MHYFKLSLRLAAATLIGTGMFALTGLAHAQVQAPTVEEPHPVDQAQWGLGLGVGMERSPYRGITRRYSALPLVMYESSSIHFFGNTLDYKLPSYGDAFTFTLRAKYDFNGGYKASQSANLQGMEDRKGALWGGATATWDNRFAKLTLEWLTAGSTKGTTLKLSAEHSFVVNSRFKLIPHISSTWMNSNYVDYYYGVKANEVTADRPAYTGQSTSNIEGGLRAEYALTPKQLILLDVNDLHRGSGIKNSPLVDKSSSAGFRLGYLYRF
ncbi:MAG TPA: MipA/OmpV family protein [Herbaspirillum sp.]|jgi:outer membrane protein|nr:MipA/OmpV family protein [Herbaspirillum sp.]